MTAKSQAGEQLRLFDPRAYDHHPPPGRIGFVYAVLMPSHAIKVGFTRNPHRRMRELANRYGGTLLVLAPGTDAIEAEYHRELAGYRIGRTEDFWPSPDVWAAVDRLRQTAA
jgi:hypothetical protein